ncbi:hypothetical protein QF023_002245 [Chryseobacterium sp. SLBN-27]|nr:hypothetical protein [Chryseobacterium sp. SLBN-27]
MNLPESYIPILIQAGVAIGFVAISLLGAHFLGPKQEKRKFCEKPKLGVWSPGRRKCKNTVFNQILFDSGIVCIIRYRNRIFLSLCSKLQRIRNGRILSGTYVRGNFLHGILLCLEARRIRLG